MQLKIFRILFIAVCVFAVAGIVYVKIKKDAYDAQIVSLQNKAASLEETVEVQKGVYTKLAIQAEELNGLLYSKDEEIKLLQSELKKSKAELLTANKLVVFWKKAYEVATKGTQDEILDPNTGIMRKKVSFVHDFGMIGVSGHTLTDPPEAFVKVQQNRPLKIGLVVSQDKDGAWRTNATSSEENVAINIDVAAVNPYIFAPKWYEKIGVSLDTTFMVQEFGFSGGVGVSYQFGKFDVGPRFQLDISNKINYGVGIAATWHPFKK